MNSLKKILLAVLLCACAIGAKAQLNTSVGIGLAVIAPSSSVYKFSPGVGIAYGAESHAALGYRVDLMSQFYIDFGEFGIKGIDPTQTSYPTTNSTLYTLGGLYMLGVDYYIIRKELFVNAGPFISYNATFDLSSNNGSKVGNINGISYGVDDLGSAINLNYGVGVGAGYQFDKHSLGLSVYLGMRDMTSGSFTDDNLKPISTHLTTVMLTYHFKLRTRSIANTTTNKLLK